MRLRAIVLCIVVCGAGCGTAATSSDAATTTDASMNGDGGAASDGGDMVENLRGARYCEVLVATLQAPNLHVEVYNTQGLNDCPQDAWSQLDANQLKMQLGATQVILNGPRYWMVDSFAQAKLIDPTPKTFGTIAMRHAGTIDVPIANAMSLQGAYVTHQVQRTTVWRFDAGKPVFELVDPMGHVYDMQSYSVQKTPQTQDDLKTLGARLMLPAGWMYRTRVLAADLLVTAVDQVAVVVQDDFDNTYQLSQQ